MLTVRCVKEIPALRQSFTPGQEYRAIRSGKVMSVLLDRKYNWLSGAWPFNYQNNGNGYAHNFEDYFIVVPKKELASRYNHARIRYRIKNKKEQLT